MKEQLIIFTLEELKMLEKVLFEVNKNGNYSDLISVNMKIIRAIKSLESEKNNERSN